MKENISLSVRPLGSAAFQATIDQMVWNETVLTKPHPDLPGGLIFTNEADLPIGHISAKHSLARELASGRIVVFARLTGKRNDGITIRVQIGEPGEVVSEYTLEWQARVMARERATSVRLADAPVQEAQQRSQPLTKEPALNFIAIDVETANSDPGSICQIGVCVYADGEERDRFSWLINPQTDFHPRNVAIHGITGEAVARQAAFRDVQTDLNEWMNGEVIISHGSFDRTALLAAFDANGGPLPSCTWIDTCELVKAAWPEHSARGYGLKPMAQRLGIDFIHHDALEDARTSGLIAIAAIATLGLPFAEVISQYGRAFDAGTRRPRAAVREQIRERASLTVDLNLNTILSDDQMELLACYASMAPDLKRVFLAAGHDALARWGAAPEPLT